MLFCAILLIFGILITQITMQSLALFAKQKLEESNARNQLRSLNTCTRQNSQHVIQNGKKLLSFSCNDYLGLSTHPLVTRAAQNAIKKYGTGSAASRLVTGNIPIYKEIEELLARMKGTEAALVFGSGYLTNIGVIPALVGKGDLIISDKLVHASLIDGCKLSGAKLLRFTHNSSASCERILRTHRNKFKNCLIITDTVFSMDGDIAPIDALYNLAEKYDAWLMTDDAHGLGVIAKPSNYKAHIQMGTLSKAVGGYGGYVCAQKIVIDYLVGAARSLIYSTALPPATLAANIAALKIIISDKTLSEKAIENAVLFTKLLGKPDAVSAIVPLIIGDEIKTILAAQILENNGFLVSAIRPPTVPRGTSRLRFAFSALHKTKDIERLVAVIKENILYE